MILFTTPTLTMRIKPTDLVFDYVLVTLTNGGITIEKKVPYEQTSEGLFIVEYTQEETGQLTVDTAAEIMLNVMIGNKRLGSCVKRIMIHKNLHKAVIDNDG